MERIQKIGLETLRSMEGILTKSAGYETSMADEIEHFENVNPTGWFLALDSRERHVGFIRCFKQGDDWSTAELYVAGNFSDRQNLAKKLMTSFLEHNHFASSHRLRFDLNAMDVELNAVIEDVNLPHKKQTFLYFEIEAARINSGSSALPVETVEATELATVLSYLNPVKESEAKSWLESGSIRVETAGARIASAAQVYFYGDSAEINRIATHGDFLRQGHARKLMAKICAELRARDIPKLFLKVEDVRAPAIGFYKDFGFQEIVGKRQTWHSLYF